MSSDHLTIRIPKRLLVGLLVLLVPAAFGAGIALGGRDNGAVVAPTTTIAATTTSPVSTTLAAPTTTVPVQKSNANAVTTTVAKKKKKAAAATTTTTEKLGVTATYADTCPAPGVNNRVQGTMTITWTSTRAVRASVRISHGSERIYDEIDADASGTLSFVRTCNNQKTATGAFNGSTLVVSYTITVYAADGTTAGTVGEGQF